MANIIFPNNKNGFIFDFDGTLVNSMWVWDNLLIDFLARHNYETPQKVLKDVAYMSMTQSSKYICDIFNIPMTPKEIYAEWNSMIYDGYAKEIKPKDGALDYLRRLKENGKVLAIATANSKELTEVCLKNNNMFDLFDVFTYADEVGTGKSDPKIYIETLNRMNLNATDTVLFEDIYTALETGKSIGLDVVIVEDKSAESDKEILKQSADLYIKNYFDLI